MDTHISVFVVFYQNTTDLQGFHLIQTLRFFCVRGEGAWLHSTEVAFLLPTQQPWVRSPAQPGFFSLMRSLWTGLRLNSSSAMQWISKMQLTLTSKAKHYNNNKRVFWVRESKKTGIQTQVHLNSEKFCMRTYLTSQPIGLLKPPAVSVKWYETVEQKSCPTFEQRSRRWPMPMLRIGFRPAPKSIKQFRRPEKNHFTSKCWPINSNNNISKVGKIT